MKKQAFTLVELIVVITILAILGTIAFISLQGYSKDARDSARLSDINNMKKVLELYKIKESKYPIPDSDYQVSYSGGLVWTQGTFGNEVFKKVNKLSNIPLDPLTNTEYTYSVLNTGKEFEIGAIMEGELSKKTITNPGISIPGLKEAQAAGETIGKSYISGTYNGKVAKTKTGTITYVLAVPSIISGDITLTDYYDIVFNKKLSYKGISVLPGSYTGTIMKVEGNSENIVNSNEIVIHEGDINSIDPETFVNNLQQAYSGTDIETDSQIADLLEISTPEEKNNYASAVIENELGGNVSSSLGGLISVGSSCDDGDPNTSNDSYNESLICEGYYIAQSSNDSNACIDGKVDWSNFTSIYCNYKGLTNIDDWVFNDNLYSLQLSGNNFSSFPDLSSFDNLRILDVKQNNLSIQDIENINNILSLRDLSISGNLNLNSLTQLSNLVNLTTLSIGETSVSDFNGVSNFPSIRFIYMSGGYHTDRQVVNNIDGLINNTTLEELSLSNTTLSDISILSTVINLYELDITSTNVSDISSLENLNYLETLFIANTSVDDISYLHDKWFYKISIDSILQPQLSTYNILYDDLYLDEY